MVRTGWIRVKIICCFSFRRKQTKKVYTMGRKNVRLGDFTIVMSFPPTAWFAKFLELMYTSTTESIYWKSLGLFWQSELLAPNFFSASRRRQPSIHSIQREKRLREVGRMVVIMAVFKLGGGRQIRRQQKKHGPLRTYSLYNEMYWAIFSINLLVLFL